jgi:hypothetical protein
VRQQDVAEEVVLHAQGFFQNFLHYFIGTTRNLNRAAYVAKLRGDDTVDGPGDRVTPVVPSPPDRQRLQERNSFRNRIASSGHRLVPCVHEEAKAHRGAYRSRNEESGEDVPAGESERDKNTCEHLGRSAGNQHCTKHREVKEARGDKEQEVEELVCFPVIANHCVDRDSIKNTLSNVVDKLHDCLYTSISFKGEDSVDNLCMQRVQKQLWKNSCY